MGSDFDLRLSPSASRFVDVDRETALADMPEFGRRFFDGVGDRFPELLERAEFFRSADPALGDFYAAFVLGDGGIGVQIDVDLDYVIVWNGELQGEYGDWGSDQVPPALQFFEELVNGSMA